MIAKRRIGHSAEEVRDFVLATDLDGLLPEYCELLLKFIPTKEEVHCTKSRSTLIYSTLGTYNVNFYPAIYRYKRILINMPNYRLK